MSAHDWVTVGRSLDRQQDYRGAVRAYRNAVALAPSSTAARTSLAFDLVRTGGPAAATTVLRSAAHQDGPDRGTALLVLGLAQRAESDPAAARTLRMFLDVAPHHPAAAQVRRLLQDQP